jgi:histidyl-tRNA synthetase
MIGEFNMEFKKPRGTRDFLFNEMKKRKKVEAILREIFENYAYREIKTPIFENLSLFTTKSGEEIIKQLYNFEDKSHRKIALRPEITAPVSRLYLNELQKTPKPIKLYYFGSCFRYERPQKGRFRQFWQFGCELIGGKSPESEGEVIAMAYNSLKKLGINTAEIHVNHLGIIRGLFKHFNISTEIQEKIMVLIDKGENKLLKESLSGSNSLIKDEELVEVLLKLLDFTENIKEDMDAINIKKDTDILNSIEKLLKGYDEVITPLNEFKRLIEILAIFKVENYTINFAIARGLDYYTGIVFEIYVPSLGTQKQICGGGTYSLIELFGHEKVESTGFAFGFDRLIEAIGEDNKDNHWIEVFVIPVSDETREKSYEIAQILREANIPTEIDLFRRKLKKNLNHANNLNVKKVILVGERDLKEGNITIKDMATGDQELIAIKNILDFFNTSH